MAKRDFPTVKGFFMYPDGNTVPFETLPEEEKTRIYRMWAERFERVLPEVLSKNPELMKWFREYETTPEEYEEYYRLFPEKRPSKKERNE